jgi:hypothetical protein
MGFWSLSIVSGILKNTAFQKLDLFPSSDERVEAIKSAGPLQRADLSPWRLAFANYPTEYKTPEQMFLTRFVARPYYCHSSLLH